MSRSINGWPVIPAYGHPELRTVAVPGANRRLTLQKDVAPVLVALAADYHRWVAPLDEGVWDEGGYNNRKTAGGLVSNHASGTAIDLNWSKEGAQGSSAGAKFFADVRKRAAIARIKRLYGPVVQWGGDWRARDYMHWEIKPGVTKGEVRALAYKLGIDNDGVRHNNWRGKPLKEKK